MTDFGFGLAPQVSDEASDLPALLLHRHGEEIGMAFVDVDGGTTTFVWPVATEHGLTQVLASVRQFLIDADLGGPARIDVLDGDYPLFEEEIDLSLFSPSQVTKTLLEVADQGFHPDLFQLVGETYVIELGSFDARSPGVAAALFREVPLLSLLSLISETHVRKEPGQALRGRLSEDDISSDVEAMSHLLRSIDG